MSQATKPQTADTSIIGAAVKEIAPSEDVVSLDAFRRWKEQSQQFRDIEFGSFRGSTFNQLVNHILKIDQQLFRIEAIPIEFQIKWDGEDFRGTVKVDQAAPLPPRNQSLKVEKSI